MAKCRTTLATAAQLARVLNLTRSRVSQLLHAENCPHVETPDGARFDLAEVVPWYMERFGDRPGPEVPPRHQEDEAMRRMVAVVHRAIREHVEALTSDLGLTRFLELLEASGLDTRSRYLAKRSAQLWLGTTLPNGEAAIMLEDPTGEPATWEQEWRAAVRKAISVHAE